MINSNVLVLNATYEPINIVSVRRAVVLLLKEKAEMIEAVDGELRSRHLRMSMPAVIRLVYYVRIPRLLKVPLSRRTVLARDYYTCQYCGAKPERSELTLDHIRPRSRGGKTTWENVVTACRRCNTRKGNRTPAEARLTLRCKPARPRYVAFAILSQSRQNELWQKYMY